MEVTVVRHTTCGGPAFYYRGELIEGVTIIDAEHVVEVADSGRKLQNGVDYISCGWCGETNVPMDTLVADGV